MLPLDDDEHGKIPGCVCLDNLQVGLAGLEVALHGVDVRGRVVEAAYRFAACGRHQRVVVGVLDIRQVRADIAADECRGCHCDVPGEFGQVVVDQGLGHTCSLLEIRAS